MKNLLEPRSASDYRMADRIIARVAKKMAFHPASTLEFRLTCRELVCVLKPEHVERFQTMDQLTDAVIDRVLSISGKIAADYHVASKQLLSGKWMSEKNPLDIS